MQGSRPIVKPAVSVVDRGSIHIQGRPGARIRNAHKGTWEALKSELGKGLDLTSGFREGERESCAQKPEWKRSGSS